MNKTTTHKYFAPILTFVIVALYGGAMFLANYDTIMAAFDQPGSSILSKTTSKTYDINRLDLLDETNKLRSSNLVINEHLNASAQDKCHHMAKYGYWSHDAPDGTEPWSFIKNHTDYTFAGENLAYGQTTSNRVVTMWKNSPTHYENILEDNYTSVGFGICDFRGTKLIVQHLKD